jgi:hypothetical protein
MEKSSVKVAPEPSRSRVEKSGNTVWKLYDSVPTRAIMARGTHNSGTLRA